MISDEKVKIAFDLLCNKLHYTIGKVASECGYSGQSYFSNQFKDRMDMSPLDYRNKHNMEIARNLLSTTTDSIETIADALNFKGKGKVKEENFIDSFKYYNNGVSPQSYRDTHKGPTPIELPIKTRAEAELLDSFVDISKKRYSYQLEKVEFWVLIENGVNLIKGARAMYLHAYANGDYRYQTEKGYWHYFHKGVDLLANKSAKQPVFHASTNTIKFMNVHGKAQKVKRELQNDKVTRKAAAAKAAAKAVIKKYPKAVPKKHPKAVSPALAAKPNPPVRKVASVESTELVMVPCKVPANKVDQLKKYVKTMLNGKTMNW